MSLAIPFSSAEGRGRSQCPLRSSPREAKKSARARKECYEPWLMSNENDIDIKRERVFPLASSS